MALPEKTMLPNYDVSDGWYGASDLGDGIWRISDHGSDNMILVIGDELAMLFDTGFGAGDLGKFVGSITDKPVVAGNSHGHIDHACGNTFFDVVYGGAEDLADLSLEDLELKRDSVRPEPLGEKADGKKHNSWGAPPKRQSIPVSDGDTLDLGGRTLTFYTTPGHTKGGICVLDSKTGAMLVGDTYVPNEYWGPIWLQLDHSTPFCVYSESLKKLAAINPKTLLSGHGEFGHLPASRLKPLIELVDGILDGSVVGVLADVPIGHGNVAFCEGAGIIYNPENLR